MASPIRLPWSQRFCFGVGHALNDLTASMWFSYLIVYLQLVLCFDSTYAGLILLIGQVADAIATPLLGYEISNIATGKLCRKYGKRKFLHLIGTVCVVISFPFIFSVCPGCQYSSEFALTIMLIPTVIIFQFGWAAVQVSHLSLIPIITPHERERDFLNVLRYIVDIGSDISTYVIVWCVLDLTKHPTGTYHIVTKEYANKFTLIVMIIVGIGAFFSMIFHLGVQEDQNSPLSTEENSTEKRQNPSSPLLVNPFSPKNLSWKGWLREIHFYQVGFLYTFVRLFQNMGAVFMPLYLQESLKANDDFIAKIPLVMNISSFVVSFTLPKIFKVLSKKITFLAGAAIGVASCAWVAFGKGPEFMAIGIYGVGVTMGIAASIMVVSSLSFIHDLIGTSAESGAFVYGCMSFFDKLANGVAVMVVQHLHSVTCDKCEWFYRYVLSYGVGSTVVISSIFLLVLLPANLGKRQSAYNGAVKSAEYKENYVSEADSLERQPLLKHSLGNHH